MKRVMPRGKNKYTNKNKQTGTLILGNLFLRFLRKSEKH